MKRSEMIKKLADFLCGEDVEPEPYSGFSERVLVVFAESIITFLEKEGMLPPPVRVLKESTVLNQETGEWETGRISCTVNEWSAEE